MQHLTAAWGKLKGLFRKPNQQPQPEPNPILLGPVFYSYDGISASGYGLFFPEQQEIRMTSPSDSKTRALGERVRPKNKGDRLELMPRTSDAKIPRTLVFFNAALFMSESGRDGIDEFFFSLEPNQAGELYRVF